MSPEIGCISPIALNAPLVNCLGGGEGVLSHLKNNCIDVKLHQYLKALELTIRQLEHGDQLTL